MLDVNRSQAAFYEQPKKNLATRLWYQLRGGLLREVRMALGVSRDGIEIQRDLMGDLEGKRVLDLGCAAGNELSLHMAERAHSYVAIDLSGRGIQKLENRLREAGFDEANTLVVDFLSDEFRERDFDLVYAHGVLHHFRHIDVLLARLQEVLVPGGRVVAYDPLNTSLVARLVRSLYRPFQTDAAWEWPFTRATFERFSRDFELEAVQGLFGYSKWAVPIFVLPIPARWKALFGKHLHGLDLKRANTIGPHLWRCLHVVTSLRVRDPATAD